MNARPDREPSSDGGAAGRSESLESPRTPAESTPLQSLVELARAVTPARILVGRSGPAYRTATQLELRAAHAAAVDAVRDELDPLRDWGPDFLARWRIVSARSEARSKQEYLLRPDWGRRLSAESRQVVVEQCPAGVDLQVALGDGLSAAAARRQIPRLLPKLMEAAEAEGWTIGRTIYLQYARVGLLNELGDLLDPQICVLLVGERPGLATAESLSAYLAYRPASGRTDADRNLVANIHDRGVSIDDAARRIVALARRCRERRKSGVEVKEAD